jgi:hypothetical protein
MTFIVQPSLSLSLSLCPSVRDVQPCTEAARSHLVYRYDAYRYQLSVCLRYRLCAAANRHLFYRLSNVMLWLAFFFIYLTKLPQSIVYVWT